MGINAGVGGAAAGSSLGPWGAVAGGAIGLLSGGGSDAAAKAEAANQARMQHMYEQQDPFSAGGNRAQYVPQLNELMRGGYQGVVNDPMFQQLQSQSMIDVQRGMSARGQGGSGQEMLALRDSSQKNMMGYFDKQYARLASLSGADAGRTNAFQGQGGQAAYAQKMGDMSAMGAGFGSVMSGLGALFGNPKTGQDSGTPNVQNPSDMNWGGGADYQNPFGGY
jgi:hypothetical protein